MTESNISEEWRLVEGWPYEVSNTGNVRRRGGDLLKPSPKGAGYPGVSLSDCKVKQFYIHDLVCRAFVGPKPSPKHEVCHNDGNILNVRASNLRWGTKTENESDKEVHGTRLSGSRCPWAKTNEEVVASIRTDHAAIRGTARKVPADTLHMLAEKYSVSHSMVRDIVAKNRRHWKRT